MKRLLLLLALFVCYQTYSAEGETRKPRMPRSEKIKRVLYEVGNELSYDCTELLKQYADNERGKQLKWAVINILKHMRTIGSLKSYVFKTSLKVDIEEFREELLFIYYETFEPNYVFEIIKTDFLLQHIAEEFINVANDVFLTSKVDFDAVFTKLISEVSWLEFMYPDSAEKKSKPLEFLEQLSSSESDSESDDADSIGSIGFSEFLDIGIE